MELREELAGVEPELAVVFEVVGSIDDLYRAVAHIPGMEWLAEFEGEDLAPDEDFYSLDRPDRNLTQTAYLVMSDRRAVEELLRLWRLYVEDERARFPHGLGRFRELFKILHQVRPWGVADRLRETGLIDEWRDRLAWGTERLVAQVELWFRLRHEDRQRQLDKLRRRLDQTGGRLVGQAVVVPEIAYHACLIEVPRRTAEQLTAGEEVELLRAEEVMFFRPVAQVALPEPEQGPAEEEAPALEAPPPTETPVAALLDSVPLAGHELLRDRIVLDDPDDWAAVVPAGDRYHATGMASLILHGDLAAGGEPLSRRLYVRPVLRPRREALGLREEFPDNVLYVDLVERAVRRLFEQEGEELPAAPDVVVVNLSFGDRWRPYAGMVSPLARLLDWLAWKYGVLFIISAGNAGDSLDIELACSAAEFQQLDAAERQRLAWQCIQDQAHLRRLFSPAESVNALTVGAEHGDAAGPYEAGNRVDLLLAGESRLPSPISAIGSGVARAIKPEVFLPGGRQLYQLLFAPGTEHVRLRATSLPRTAPGQQVAAPGEPGVLTAIRYTCGTSNSAALATRATARLYDRLPDLFGNALTEERPPRPYLVPLLEALLVHGASWGSGQDVLRPLMGGDLTTQKVRLGRFLGYGFVDTPRLDGCTEQRVTLAAWGEIEAEEGHLYRVPLPASLDARQLWRRLTITLAYLTPINPFDKRYRRAQVWFTLKDEDQGLETPEVLGVTRQEAHWQTATRGTVQHEILAGERAVGFGPEGEIVIKVNCTEHAGRLRDPVPYALVVSLEVAPGTEVPVYQEVEVRLRQRVPVRPLGA